MRSDTKFVLVLMVCGVIFACSMVFLNTMPVKTTDEISMVDVCGWPWCASYDAHYAQEVNLPNSQANLNNSTAEKEEAEAERLRAEAATLRIQETETRAQLTFNTFCLTSIFLISIFGALLLVAAKAGVIRA